MVIHWFTIRKGWLIRWISPEMLQPKHGQRIHMTDIPNDLRIKLHYDVGAIQKSCTNLHFHIVTSCALDFLAALSPWWESHPPIPEAKKRSACTPPPSIQRRSQLALAWWDMATWFGDAYYLKESFVISSIIMVAYHPPSTTILLYMCFLIQ